MLRQILVLTDFFKKHINPLEIATNLTKNRKAGATRIMETGSGSMSGINPIYMRYDDERRF